jgi:hypothetical protein
MVVIVVGRHTEYIPVGGANPSTTLRSHWIASPTRLQKCHSPKPHTRSTWSPHSSEGWYFGPATDAYRCDAVSDSNTRRARTTDTLQCLPYHVPLPTVSDAQLIHFFSLLDILHALEHPSVPPTALDLHPLHRRTIQQLAENFGVKWRF